MEAIERTFIMIKPEGVRRGLIGKIISRFEEKYFSLKAIKIATPGRAHFEKHYSELKNQAFFRSVVEYASSGPVCAMVWEG